MAVISLGSGDDIWHVSGRAFERVIATTQIHVDKPTDRDALLTALAVSGLQLEFFDETQRRRLVRALQTAVSELQRQSREASRRSESDPHHLDPSFLAALTELEALLKEWAV